MLLALDINSNRTGYAFGAREDAKPRSDAWKLPGGEDLPRACASLYNSISGVCGLIHPNFVAIEAPLQMMIGSAAGARPAFVLKTLYGAAIAAAHNAKARVAPVSVGTWRKYFIGAGNLKGPEAKERSIARCKQLGWKAENHDEAEACGVWAWGLSHCYREYRFQWSPLFAGVAA